VLLWNVKELIFGVQRYEKESGERERRMEDSRAAGMDNTDGFVIFE
jgi:hypothetical protein